jgi:hypothetical protein
MTNIELTGIRADLPIGFMAAIGCLRVCQRMEEFRGSKLSWATSGGSFSAVLHSPSSATADQLVLALLVDVKRATERPELNWRPKLKGLDPATFHDAADHAVEGGGEAAQWFAAFACETAKDREGYLEPTPLDMTGGPQEFLGGICELAQKLSTTPKSKKAKTPEQAFREALFGPWRYEDDQHSLGWDPTTIKLGAFTNQAPTKMANAGVMAAVWLAFESLPMFPVFSARDIRGFERARREWIFSWPVWESPLSLDAIGSFLALEADDMIAHGAAAVYQSRRFYLNKYYAAFRTPALFAAAD